MILSSRMAVNVDITKSKNENNLGVLRKFSKKVKVSGVLQKKRSLRYFERSSSAFRKKADKLKRIEKTEEYIQKDKMGLLKPRTRRR